MSLRTQQAPIGPPEGTRPRGKAAPVLLLVLGVAVAVALLLYYVRPTPDCAFSGWKSTVGVDLEAKVGDLDAVRTKVGLTSAEVREFDTLLKDYAAKYEANCRDVKNGRKTQADYTCRRANMDGVLDRLRTFAQALTAAQGIKDPHEQAAQIRSVLDDLRSAARTDYARGCVSAISVDPDSITFAKDTPERSIHVGNGGNNDLTFAIDRLPEAFLAYPPTGNIPRGAQPLTVSIIRTIMPATEGPITFRIRSNLAE